MSRYAGKHVSKPSWAQFQADRMCEDIRIPGRHRAPQHADRTIEEITTKATHEEQAGA